MAEAPHLLIVDDDDRIRSLLKRYLSTAGYRITTAADATAARVILQETQIDLAILDIMMPGEDGLSLMEAIRQTRDTPVIILSARVEGADRIEGLKRGADDYLTKPFEPEELSLRIGAILRRMRPPTAPVTQLGFSGLVYDVARQTLRRGEDYIPLSQAERLLLAILTEEPRKAVTAETLAAALSDHIPPSVKTQILALQGKIEQDPSAPKHLQILAEGSYQLTPDD